VYMWVCVYTHMWQDAINACNLTYGGGLTIYIIHIYIYIYIYYIYIYIYIYIYFETFENV